MTSMQRFNESFLDAAQFPRNLIFHDTYDDSLRRYSERLYKNQERLFCEEAGTSVDFWQRDDQATGRRRPLAYMLHGLSGEAIIVNSFPARISMQ